MIGPDFTFGSKEHRAFYLGKYGHLVRRVTDRAKRARLQYSSKKAQEHAWMALEASLKADRASMSLRELLLASATLPDWLIPVLERSTP